MVLDISSSATAAEMGHHHVCRALLYMQRVRISLKGNAHIVCKASRFDIFVTVLRATQFG